MPPKVVLALPAGILLPKEEVRKVLYVCPVCGSYIQRSYVPTHYSTHVSKNRDLEPYETTRWSLLTPQQHADSNCVSPGHPQYNVSSPSGGDIFAILEANNVEMVDGLLILLDFLIRKGKDCPRTVIELANKERRTDTAPTTVGNAQEDQNDDVVSNQDAIDESVYSPPAAVPAPKRSQRKVAKKKSR